MTLELSHESSRPLPVELTPAFAAAKAEVPKLDQIFGRFEHPTCMAEWWSLPTTGPLDYAEAKTVTSSVRNLDKLFAPSAPFDLSSPSFPFSVLHSYTDKLALDQRLAEILELTGCGASEDFIFVSGRHQRYFAADLAELLIALGHGCVFMLLDRPSPTDFARIQSLEAQYLFWFLAEPIPERSLPDSVCGVVTFSRHPRLRSKHHVDVLQLDEAPLLAYGEGMGRYSFAPSHFYLEHSNRELLVTTLRQDMLPLVRYRTGWLVQTNEMHEASFTLEEL